MHRGLDIKWSNTAIYLKSHLCYLYFNSDPGRKGKLKSHQHSSLPSKETKNSQMVRVQNLEKLAALHHTVSPSSVMRDLKKRREVTLSLAVLFADCILKYACCQLCLPNSAIKQFYSKLEEKIHARELEISNLQAKSKVPLCSFLLGNVAFQHHISYVACWYISVKYTGNWRSTTQNAEKEFEFQGNTNAKLL